jgi:hypothetical protein
VCTVTVKVHGEKWASNKSRVSLSKLLKYKGSRVVVSERHDVAAQECSNRYALMSGNHLAHGGDHAAQERWAKENCPSHASPAFQRKHDEWYEWVRQKLHKLGKPYLEMPFEEYVGDVQATEAMLHAFAGLSPQPFRGACQDGCNCDRRPLGL